MREREGSSSRPAAIEDDDLAGQETWAVTVTGLENRQRANVFRLAQPACRVEPVKSLLGGARIRPGPEVGVAEFRGDPCGRDPVARDVVVAQVGGMALVMPWTPAFGGGVCSVLGPGSEAFNGTDVDDASAGGPAKMRHRP